MNTTSVLKASLLAVWYFIAAASGPVFSAVFVAPGSTASAPTNTIVGHLTPGVIPKASGSTNLSDGPISVSNGTNASMAGVFSANGGAFTNTLTLNGSPVLTSAVNAPTNTITGTTPLTQNIFPIIDASGTNLINGPMVASGTNATITGNFSANGAAFTNTLTLNGNSVLTNAANWTASGTTNSTLAGNAAVNSLTVTNANGITSTGETTITTATGQLDLKTGGGNANVVITPNGTGCTVLNGNVCIGETTPVAPLSIQGDQRLADFNSTNASGGYLTISRGGSIKQIFGLYKSSTGGGITIDQDAMFFRSSAGIGFGGNGATVNEFIDTAGNFGIWTTGPNSTFEDAGSFALNVTTGSGVTLDSTHSIYLCNVNAQTVTLPSAVGIKNRIYLIKCIAPATICTVTNATGAQLIDGALSYSLSASNKFVRVVSDNANWWIIGSN